MSKLAPVAEAFAKFVANSMTTAKLDTEQTINLMGSTLGTWASNQTGKPNKPELEGLFLWFQTTFGENANVDQVQIKLILWTMMLETIRNLEAALVVVGGGGGGGGGGVDQAQAKSTCEALMQRMKTIYTQSGLTDNEQSPFALTLKVYFPNETFNAAPPEGLVKMPRPFVLQGLPGNVCQLNGVYEYHSVCAGKAAYRQHHDFKGAAQNYFVYWAPLYNRWYVGPELGSNTILFYKQTSDDASPNFPFDDQNGTIAFWNNKKWVDGPFVRIMTVDEAVWSS